jgi:peptide-methionine (S)-S-oxide reductase
MKASLRSVAVAIAVAAIAGHTSAQAPAATLGKATFAGGCFWCVEADFDKVDGVVSTTSGYIGGSLPKPTYAQVSAGTTGHAEAVEIVFDPRRVSYEQLLAAYWVSVDPTVGDRQFCDIGSQYRPAIFVHDEAQRRAAEASKAKATREKPFREPIVVPIETASTFYPAEDYHQDYYRKNPIRYRHYRSGCGRDARLRQLWSDRAVSAVGK